MTGESLLDDERQQLSQPRRSPEQPALKNPLQLLANLHSGRYDTALGARVGMPSSRQIGSQLIITSSLLVLSAPVLQWIRAGQTANHN